jgi:outer membrane receptor protein involved in Fe transport
MPEYHLGNLHAGVTRGGLGVEAYIKNVGNSYGITRLVSEVRDGYDAPLAAAIIQPRTFGLSISYRF